MRPKLVPELICSNFERSLAVYVGALGFAVRYARPEERFAFLERDGAELMIEQPHGRDRLWPKVAFEQPYGRGVNLQIEVSDVVALHGASLAAGLTLVLQLEQRWYRRDGEEVGNWQFAVEDPDGYVLRFFQNLGSRPTRRF